MAAAPARFGSITSTTHGSSDLTPCPWKSRSKSASRKPRQPGDRGHLGLSGSFVETLQEFFNTDHMTWTDTAAGKTMTYTRLSDALNEIMEVRIWSGIHFRAADEQSAHLAKLAAKWRKRVSWHGHH